MEQGAPIVFRSRCLFSGCVALALCDGWLLRPIRHSVMTHTKHEGYAMKRYVARLLTVGLLVFVGALGCRPGASPSVQPSADMPTAEYGEADSQPTGTPGVEAEGIEADDESAMASARLLAREYAPPDTLFISAVFPRRTLARPELADAPIEQVLRKIGHLDRPLEMPVPSRFFTELSIDLDDVEHVVCIVTGIRTARDTRRDISEVEGVVEPQKVILGSNDEAVTTGDAELEEANQEEELEERTAEEGPSQEPTRFEQDPWLYGPLMEAYIVRLTGVVPRQAAVDLLFRPEEVTLGGRTYFGQDKDTGALAIHFPDKRTMIVGEERVIRKMLSEAKGTSALTESLQDLDLDSDIVGILNVAKTREHVMPKTDSASRISADDARVATFSVRLDPRPSAKFVVHVKDAEAGERSTADAPQRDRRCPRETCRHAAQARPAGGPEATRVGSGSLHSRSERSTI